MNKETILVTGGCGYIGSVIVHKLLRANYKVIVVDNLSGGSLYSIGNVCDRLTLYQINIGDYESMDRIFNCHKILCVIHCAGYLNVNESVSNPLKYYENNVGNAIILLKVMQKYQCNKLVFSSTCAVYGIPNRVPITEDDEIAPITPYGNSKRIFEKILIDMASINEMNSVILRYFNVGGAYYDHISNKYIGECHEPETHLIPIAIDCAFHNKIFSLYGNDYNTFDETCVRDYIHVEDLADAHIMAVEKLMEGKLIRHNIYNLGNQKGYSVKQILNLVQEITNQEIQIKFQSRREGDPDALFANSSKIKNELGWESKYTIRDIISSAIIFENQIK